MWKYIHICKTRSKYLSKSYNSVINILKFNEHASKHLFLLIYTYLHLYDKNLRVHTDAPIPILGHRIDSSLLPFLIHNFFL